MSIRCATWCGAFQVPRPLQPDARITRTGCIARIAALRASWLSALVSRDVAEPGDALAAGHYDCVYLARVNIDANVGLHPKEPLVAILGLVHLGVALTTAVPGRTRRGNQGGINHRARLEYQALGS